MPEGKIDTDILLRRLLKTSSIRNFLRHYNTNENQFPALSEYITGLCAKKEVSAESVIKKANIERTYGHKFFNGSRVPSRDKVLQLALGFELNLEETQKLLAVARQSPLHPRVKRDAVIIFVLKKGHSLFEVQSVLSDLNLPILGKEQFYEQPAHK